MRSRDRHAKAGGKDAKSRRKDPRDNNGEVKQVYGNLQKV